jgi:FkbM family methyltransferase
MILINWSIGNEYFKMLKDKILKHINFKDGNYIEIGAFDGIFQSNTNFLENDYNWTGILIEPSPNVFEKLIINRPNNKLFNCACVSFDYKKNKISGDFNNKPMSSVGGFRKKNKLSIEVDAYTMDEILIKSEFKKFDFLSLDVEGYELEVLKGINFKKTKITWVLIEVYNNDKENIFKFMSDKGYDLICNLSVYNHDEYPNWDGTHNDYLFKLI